MAMVYPEQQENSLERAYQIFEKTRCNENIKRIIQEGSGFIYYFLRLYGSSLNESDLYQVGVEGLLKAVKRYDASLGASFTTYAAHLIVGEIRHFVRKEASYYKPGCIAGLQFKVDKEIEIALKKTGRVPSVQEIADKLNIREESVNEVMKAGLVDFDDIDKSKIASQRLENFKLPIEDQISLTQAVNKLTELQKKVILMLFYRDMTQEQTASLLGFNQRKISRIKEKSLQILRQELRES